VLNGGMGNDLMKVAPAAMCLINQAGAAIRYDYRDNYDRQTWGQRAGFGE
jgi:hypothetical protein